MMRGRAQFNNAIKAKSRFKGTPLNKDTPPALVTAEVQT